MSFHVNSGAGSPRPTRTVDDQLQGVLNLARVHDPGVDLVPLAECEARILSEEVFAHWDIPRFAQSAMDGFALRLADWEDHLVGLPVVARIFAGEPAAALTSGTAVRIMTGAEVPAGADTIIPFENARLDQSGSVLLPLDPEAAAALPLGSYVRHPGEDVRSGQSVLRPGTRLTARHLAAAAALGFSRLPVRRRPQVAVITTGDELLPAGSTPGQAQIIDSNSVYLGAALNRAGCHVTCYRSGDDPVQFSHIVEEASGHDLVLVTGGASQGDKDVARDVLSRSGIEFVAVAMQPGKPQGAGLWCDRTPMLSLPGNPVSVAVSFAVFVRPLLAAMLSTPLGPPRWAQVTRGWRSVTGRRQFFPVRLTPTAQGLLAEPASPGGSASHLVTSLSQADAFAVVPEASVDVLPGDRLELVDLD